MKSLLLLLMLISPLHAQMGTLPQQVDDPATDQDLTYLYQKIINNIVPQTLNCPPGTTTCVTFPDGTTQNTAPASSSSVNLVAGSTITISTVASTSGAVITIGNHPICSGLPCVQVSTSPANQTTLTIANLDANAYYCLYVSSFTQQAAVGGEIQYRFGTSGSTVDSTAGHYAWKYTSVTGSGSNAANANNSDTQCRTSFLAGHFSMSPGVSAVSQLCFSTAGGSAASGTPGPYSLQHFDSDDSDFRSYNGGCWYLQASPIVNVSVLDAAGSWKGTVNLMRWF